MDVLLYGGCHALVLRDYLEAACPGEIACTLIVNFELIRSGAPFPYDALRGFDAVVYSPIENKGAYNTSHLDDACRRLGLLAIRYPWLEWHGYCPGAAKGTFAGRVQWFYPALAAEAAGFAGSFEAFCDQVIACFPDDRTIDACLETSTAHLRAAEQRHDTSFSVCAHILAGYRAQQLFLVPDHPGRQLYGAVLLRILERLGMAPADAVRRLARLPPGEPQGRWRTPIFPRVAQRLGLAFADGGWVDDEAVPGRAVDLRTYLRFYFHPGSTVLAPRGEVRDPALRVLAQPLEEGYLMLDVLAGAAAGALPGCRVASAQWRAAWPG